MPASGRCGRGRFPSVCGARGCGVHRGRVALLACFVGSCATIRAEDSRQRPWCNDASQASVAPDWTRLEESRPVPVHPEALAKSRRRLAHRSVLPIASDEAARLTRHAARPSRAQAYLIRGGLLMEAGATGAEIAARMRDPDLVLLEVHWSESLNALGVNVLSALDMRALNRRSAVERPQAYDVPLVVRARVRPRNASVSCTATIH